MVTLAELVALLDAVIAGRAPRVDLDDALAGASLDDIRTMDALVTLDLRALDTDQRDAPQ